MEATTERLKILQCDDVEISFSQSGTIVLRKIDFSLFQGERVALLGLNGSGKSTLLAAIVGLIPFSGKIIVNGLEVSQDTLNQVRKEIGFLFTIPDDQILFPRVVDDVAFSLVQRGVKKSSAVSRAKSILESLDSGDILSMSPDELSHGQRLRVALAGAIISEPTLLLLDEPSAGLDPPGVKALSSYLCSCKSSMLIASHDLNFARTVCQRYVLLDSGEIVLNGSDFSDIDRFWGLQ